jgi:NAD(P)H dehydrogenase (quinone)
MRALVVVADPDPESFTHALAADAASALGRGGHHLDVLDLCAMDYRAAMSPAEKLAYDSDDPVVDEEVAGHVALVRAATMLVVVYPTLLNGPPAVLGGWFERTMVPGVAFVFDRRHKVRPGLTSMRRLVGISTYDTSRWRVRVRGDAGRRLVTRTLRTSTGWRARPTWLALYDTHPSDREAFRTHVREALGKLR